MAKPCSPKHSPVVFTVLKTLFFWMVWSVSKTFELMAGPCSPKHGPVLFTVLRNRFVWKLCSRLKTMKFVAGQRSPLSPVTAQFISRRWRIVSFWCYADFQQRSNERMVVLPKTRSRSFHGVEKLFCLDDMKRFKNIRSYGWAVLPQTRPSSFHGVKESSFLDVLQSDKNLQVYGWAALPNISVTAQLILRLWRIISFWCCADFQQRSNERLVVLPQTRSRAFHGVEDSFHQVGMKLFRNIRIYGLAVLPQARPSFFDDVEESICLDVLQFCKHIQVYGWAAFPNIFYHGSAHFAALKNHFVLMLRGYSTMFQWTAGRATPNTVQLWSRCWRTFSFGWYEAFQKHWNHWLSRTPQSTAQFFSRCWKTISSGCYAAI